MYYITNQNNQFIAVDSNLLALLGVENIDELYRKIALGDIAFSPSSEDKKITITTAQDTETYHIENTDLSGILGNITLTQLLISSEEPIDNEAVSIEEFLDTAETAEENENELFNLTLPSEAKETINNDPAPMEDLLALEISEENEISIADDTSEEFNKAEGQKEDIEDKKELFDLILPNAPENAIDEIPQAVDATSPIFIDIENISQKIGISSEDYNTFLNEYIDTALSLEKDLQSTQEEKRSNAIHTLSHLSHVLHLPVVTEILTQIENASGTDQDTYIKAFYATLARLISSGSELDSIDIQKEKSSSAAKNESDTETKKFDRINLDDVKPIHFDFQLEEAAKDLNLPVELIEEFVHDFIKQAHDETEKMLEAYERGDLKTIQKIGHLLKGASSNLRINPLSDTLYEIQFSKDISNMENLIKYYWGHFLSLETQMNLTSK